MLWAKRTITEAPSPNIFKMHTHDCYEIFVFYAGDACYHVEGTVYPLQAGDILIMKRAEAHTLWINRVAPYDRTVINFSTDMIPEPQRAMLQDFLEQRPLGRFNRYPASLFSNTRWLAYVEKIYTHRDDPAYMQTYLTVLLTELWEAFPEVQAIQQQPSGQISDIITYINSNFCSNTLSIHTLCDRFFISNTQLNRLFHQMTGVPVWKYVVTKRMLHAKALLDQGQPPTEVCYQCGYHDYSPFFRAYKAHFGVSPAGHKLKAK